MMGHPITIKACRAALASFIFFVSLSVSANTAVTLPDANSLLQTPPALSVLGYEFVSSTDMEITAVGILDDSGDGLSSPHTLAIWDDSGDTLLQILVPAGSGDLENGFRFIDVNPLALNADTKYVIGVYYLGGNLDNIAAAAFPAEYQLASAISITSGRSRIGSLGFPMTETSDVYFGPNFKFTPIPLPGAVWLMISALGILGITKRR